MYILHIRRAIDNCKENNYRIVSAGIHIIDILGAILYQELFVQLDDIVTVNLCGYDHCPYFLYVQYVYLHVL